jgi:streptogramin lyase
MNYLTENRPDKANISLQSKTGAGWLRLLVLVALCLVLGILLWSGHQSTTAALLATTASSTTTPYVVEYPLPSANAQPRHIVAEAPGRLWFTLPGVNALGSLVVTTTVDYEFNSYDLPTANSEPHNLVLDAGNGVIWFTQLAANQIGRFDLATHQIDQFPIPTANSAPTGIDLDSNGIVWVALRNTNKVARLNPATGHIDEFPYPTAGAQFADLSVSSSNIVWITAPGLNRLVSYDPGTGTFTNVPVTDFGLDPFPPQAIAMQANRPWISAPTQGWLGRYSPGTLTFFLWYPTPQSTSGPTDIHYRNVGTNSEVWYVQPSANRIGRILVDNQDNMIDNIIAGLPTANGQPQGVTVDSNGHAWVTAPGSNTIVEWRPPYVDYVFLPLVMQP